MKKYGELKSEIQAKQSLVNEASKNIEELVAKLGELREKVNKLNKELEKAKLASILNAKKQEVQAKSQGKRRLTIDELKIMYGEPEDFLEDSGE